MYDLADFSQVVQALYDAVTDLDQWSMLAALIARTLKADSCSIQLQNAPAGRVNRMSFTENYTPEILAAYRAYYYQHDVWAKGGLEHPPETVLLSHEVMPESVFKRTEIYNGHCKPANIFHGVGAMIFQDPDNTVGLISVCRPLRAKRFDEHDRQFIRLLMPQLKQALRLTSRFSALEAINTGLFAVLEVLSIGCLVVDDSGRLLFANARGEEILRASDCLRTHDGVVHALDSTRDDHLHKLIRQAANTACGRALDGGGGLGLPRRGRQALTLAVCPLSPRTLPGEMERPAALLMVNVPEQQYLNRETLLSSIYGLSPAESKLVVALLNGQSLNDYADLNCKSIHTVRTQLKHIFGKTGHARQADLIRDILANPVLRLVQNERSS